MTAKTSTRVIEWRHRLETRVAAGISLLVALSIGAVLIVTTRAVTTRALDSARGDLDAAAAQFSHLVDDRAEFAAAQAALVTALPVFRSHMTDVRLASDVAELQVLGEEYRGLMKADFCIVADRVGQWTAAPGWPLGDEHTPAVGASIAAATAGRPRRSIAAIAGRLYLVVSEPARFSDEVLGTLTAGFVLDDAIARRLSQETHCEINLVADGRLCASSLNQHDRDALARLVANHDARIQSGTTPSVSSIGQGQYIAGRFPLPPDSPDPAIGPLILLQDWTPTAALIRESQQLVVGVGALSFLAALGLGWLFSRRISQPIAELVEAAGDIAGGNWTRQVTAKGSAETTMMADAFNDMTTSLRHWYEEARKRDDELRHAQKMEAIGRLAGGVAHDFNNMLTAIKGYGELLASDLDADPRQQDAEEIIKAANRAADLTRQLLTFSRREVVATRILKLDDVVRGTEQMLRRLIGEDIRLTSRVAADLWRINGDVGQLEQVLVNLAVNARDAMAGGGDLAIEASNVHIGDGAGIRHPTLQPGRYVRLVVADSGCGMDAETSARIFEPFFTTKEAGRGTGLGLAMVYGVVEQSGGAIDVDSAVGKGTRFLIYLPATIDEQTDEQARGPVASTPTLGDETILLVEDDSEVGTLLGRSLGRAGYRVLSASSAEQALDIVRSGGVDIDLLLTDVVMPGMNGRELSEHVLADRPGTPVLFMSGYSDDAVLRRGIQTAAAHFIQKPFSVEDLARKIRDILALPSEAAS